jgi:transposase
MYLGMDIAKESLDVYLLKGEGGSHYQVTNELAGFRDLHRWLKKHKASQVHVCMEATGIYGIDVAQFLHDNGYRVSVVNPARIKGFAVSQMRRSKTDRLDAEVIAAFCKALEPSLWTPPEPAWYELRALLRHLEDLQITRQQQVNRLHAATTEVVRTQLQQHIAFIDEQIEQLKQQVRVHLRQHPTLRDQIHLLTSIPGIGELTAWRLVAEIQALSRFDDVRQLVAYVGLDPSRHDSGSRVRGAHSISRQGRAALRAALYMPALVAMKHNPILQAFAARLTAQGKLPQQVIVAVMRKLLHLVYGILKSGLPFNPNYPLPT